MDDLLQASFKLPHVDFYTLESMQTKKLGNNYVNYLNFAV